MANWDVTTASSILEFDTVSGGSDSCAVIDVNNFITLWSGNAGSYAGSAQVFSVNTTTWAITTAGSKFGFDTNAAASASAITIVKIDTNHFVGFYSGVDADGFVSVFSVNTTTWAITTTSSLEFDTADGGHNASCLIDENHIINFWSGGDAQVFTVNTSTWEISTAAAVKTGTGLNANSCIKIDTNHFINFYRGGGDDGFAQVVTVNTSNWEITTSSSSLEFDTQQAYYTSAIKVDNTHALCFWYDSSGDGRCQTFAINTTTWAITTAASSFEYDTQVGSPMSVKQLDVNHFLYTYYGYGATNTVYAQTFEINTSTWAVSTTVAKLAIQASGNAPGQVNYGLCAIDTSHFTFFFPGTDSDGFAQVLNVEVPAAAGTASPSVSPSISPSASGSASPSRSPSVSPSASESRSPSSSASASESRSPSRSPSVSESASYSPSASESRSPSRSASASESRSPSRSASASESRSPSRSPSVSESASYSPSASESRSPSRSASASESRSPSASGSRSPSVSESASYSPSASESRSPSASESRSPSISASASESRSPSVSASASPSGPCTVLIDNFDSYSTGDLNGQGSWSGDVNFDVTTDQSQSASNSVQVALGGDATARRIEKTFCELAAGVQTWYMRGSAANSRGLVIIAEDDDATNNIVVYFMQNSNYLSYYSGGVVNHAAVLSDTWYKISVEWRSSPDKKFRIQLDSAGWSDWLAPYAEWTNGLNILALDAQLNTGSGTVYWDTFAEPVAESASPSRSPSASESRSPSISPSASESRSPSISASASASRSPSVSESASYSPSASASRSPSASESRSPSRSASASESRSPSVSESASYSPSASGSQSPSASASRSPSISPSASESRSPSVSESASYSPSASESRSPSASESASPSVSPSASESRSPSASESQSPSVSPSASESRSPSASESASPSRSPSASASVSPSASPSAEYDSNSPVYFRYADKLSLRLPPSRINTWNTGGRPTAKTGAIGYNITTAKLEIYDGSDWQTITID